MFEKMYIEGDRRFKKSRFILLFAFNIAAVCVKSIAAYNFKFGAELGLFLIQLIFFIISAFCVKKYEADIAGGENYVKTKKYALFFIAAKIVALILGSAVMNLSAPIVAAKPFIPDDPVQAAIPDIFGYIAVAAALSFIMAKLKKKGAAYNRYRLFVYALNIAAVPWIVVQILMLFVVLLLDWDWLFNL